MIEVKKIAIPFAQSGNKSIIYDYRQQGQAENEATWATGFPPVTMIRKEEGGLPPTGLDFNGIFHDISSNVVFSCMGGRYKFDKDYAEKIGGYPKGAILLNNQENKQYISNIDNNKVDFNTADPAKLTQWSVISIADIDKVIDSKISNADFSQALNQKANTSTNINAGNGLTGGGNLTTSRTIELGTPTSITQSSTNSVTATSHTHSISKATTSQQGIVQLTSTLSDREDLSATPKMVNDVNRDVVAAQKTANTANDKANTAQTRADSAYNLANSKQDKLSFVGSGPEVMKAGAYGLGSFGNLLKGDPLSRDIETGFYMTTTSPESVPNSSNSVWIYLTGNVYRRAYIRLAEGNQFFIRTSGNADWASEVRVLTEQHVVQSSGTSTTNVMSQKAVSDRLNSIESSHGLGYEQKWVDVTSQRSAGTTYINDTGKPIIVILVYRDMLQVEIDGLKMGGYRYNDFLNFIIPPRSTYKITGGIGNILSFFELR